MPRRAAAGGCSRAAPAPGRPEIRITDIKTFLVGLGRNHVFVKVETDQGIHGIGEAYSCGPDQATVAAIDDFKDWLVGQDPRNIEHLWAMMYNFSRFPGGSVVNAAISGIEHALWDIAGKAAGLPVYRLLGGKCREKVRVYQGIGGAEPQPTGGECQGRGREVRLHRREDVAAPARACTPRPTTP